MNLLDKAFDRLEDIKGLGLIIFMKTVLFLVFVLFCYGGAKTLFEWLSGESLGVARSPVDSTLLVTNPIIRWISAVAIVFVFLLTISYMLYSRIRRVNILFDILRPISLPERYTQKIRDAVEGISIASGVQPPEILFLKNDCLNAFTLSQPERTSLFLTRGLLVSLDKEELTAVVAHEFAHIKKHDVHRFQLPGGICWKLVKVKAREREWMKLVGVLLPVLLWIAVIGGVTVLTLYNPEAASLFLTIASFLVATPLLVLFIDFRPKYSLPKNNAQNLGLEMYSDEIEADREALSWTYYPEGMVRALNKCHGRSYSPQLLNFDGIAFARTVPPSKTLLSSKFSRFRVYDRQYEDRLHCIEAMNLLLGTRL